MGILSKFTKGAAAAVILTIGGVGAASAAPVLLDNSLNCTAGNAINGISVGDVTGNAGGSTDCWGTWDGNDPGPSGDGFDMSGMQFDYWAKQDIGGALDDPNGTGLSVTAGSSGTWSITSAIGSDFLIVLKAANSPGFAAWLFSGADAASTSGTFNVAWTTGQGGANPGLSHLAIYKKDTNGGGGGPNPVPVPASGLLLLAGFGGLAAMRRFKKT